MNTRKRSNKYLANHNRKRPKRPVIEPGMTGFLCTCNFHEKRCITDAYKLLTQFADEESAPQMIKESKVSSTSTIVHKEKQVNEYSEDEDISVTLKREINDLKTEYEVPLLSRKFQAVETGVKNIIFITSTLSSPLKLVTKILTELDTTKKQCTRYLLRLLPIEVVCKAYMNDIKTKANALFEKYFSQEPKTFSIVFNHHYNNSIKRDEIIQDLAEIVLSKNPGNKTDLKNPEIAVVIEVIRGICLFCIAPNYYKFKKYNLVQICSNTKSEVISNGCEKSTNKESNQEDLDIMASREAKEYTNENKCFDTKSEGNIRLEAK